MANREWTEMDEEAASQGNAINQIRKFVGSIKISPKRPQKTALATVGNKDRWANRGKSLVM